MTLGIFKGSDNLVADFLSQPLDVAHFNVLDKELLFLTPSQVVEVRAANMLQKQMQKYHDNPVAGHRGTVAFAHKYESWKHMGVYIHQFVACCKVCLARKHSTTKYQGLLIPLPIIFVLGSILLLIFYLVCLNCQEGLNIWFYWLLFFKNGFFGVHLLLCPQHLLL